jgi:hypothetical protein
MSEAGERVGGVSDAALTDAVLADDARAGAIWREWIATLAESADAALAAAIAYERLDPTARLEWLEAIEQEAHALAVPLIAAYGPLLAVEKDDARRSMMEAALRRSHSEVRTREDSTCKVFATPGALRRIVVLAPTYLSFQQVITCRAIAGVRFISVAREPFVHVTDGPRAGDETPEGPLEPMPLGHAVDILARTIVAHERSGGSVPRELCALADLFGGQWNSFGVS